MLSFIYSLSLSHVFRVHSLILTDIVILQTMGFPDQTPVLHQLELLSLGTYSMFWQGTSANEVAGTFGCSVVELLTLV